MRKTKLQDAMDEIKKEEELRISKNKKIYIRKEKSINYYSNWNKDDKKVDETKGKKQTKISEF